MGNWTFVEKFNIFNQKTKEHGRKFMLTKGNYISKEQINLESEGETMLTETWKGKKNREEDICFWGEWEAQSYLLLRFQNSENSNLPKFLVKPFYNISQRDFLHQFAIALSHPSLEESSPSADESEESKIHNEDACDTDPFVFHQGEGFKYTYCRQFTRKGFTPVALRYLEKGSVILFGSTIGNEFVMDCCFVVADFIDLSSLTKKEVMDKVPRCYW